MLRNTLAALGAFASMAVAPSTVMADQMYGPDGAFAFTFEAIDGTELPLSRYSGKVLMVVNTASMCGFTGQYEALQGLWERYESAGLVVIGVPSNDFGGQEPKSEKEIVKFCKGAFGVTFPLTAKQRVVGESAHPFYRWARETLGAKAAPRWNFHKYIVNRDGRLIASFATTVKPDSAKVTRVLEGSLKRD